MASSIILNESNRIAIRLDSGVTAFYSYKTLVAAQVPGVGNFKTNQYYSRTTSKHLGQFGMGGAEAVDQDALEKMVK
jgi:hypothetical protein